MDTGFCYAYNFMYIAVFIVNGYRLKVLLCQTKLINKTGIV